MKETELELGKADKGRARVGIGENWHQGLEHCEGSCSSLLVLASLSISLFAQTGSHAAGAVVAIAPALHVYSSKTQEERLFPQLMFEKSQHRNLIGLTWVKCLFLDQSQ